MALVSLDATVDDEVPRGRWLEGLSSGFLRAWQAHGKRVRDYVARSSVCILSHASVKEASIVTSLFAGTLFSKARMNVADTEPWWHNPSRSLYICAAVALLVSSAVTNGTGLAVSTA